MRNLSAKSNRELFLEKSEFSSLKLSNYHIKKHDIFKRIEHINYSSLKKSIFDLKKAQMFRSGKPSRVDLHRPKMLVIQFPKLSL